MKGRFVNNIVLLLLLFVSAASAQELPKNMLGDQYTLSAKRHYEKKEFKESCESFQKVVDLNIEVPDDFYFFYGRSLVECEEFSLAKEILTKYILITGNASKFYEKALELRSIAEERQIEEQKRIAEKEAKEKAEKETREKLNGSWSYENDRGDREYSLEIEGGWANIEGEEDGLLGYEHYFHKKIIGSGEVNYEKGWVRLTGNIKKFDFKILKSTKDFQVVYKLSEGNSNLIRKNCSVFDINCEMLPYLFKRKLQN